MEQRPDHQPPAPEFVHEIHVRWADCDPARIAYTGRIPYFACDAIDAWWEAVVGQDWYHMNIDRNVGTPFVHMSLDFRSPVTPRHILRCTVKPVRLGSSSIRLRVEGYQNGGLCFEGEFVEVFVVADKHSSAIDVPDDIRAKIEAHIAA